MQKKKVKLFVPSRIEIAFPLLLDIKLETVECRTIGTAYKRLIQRAKEKDAKLQKYATSSRI